LIDKAYNLILSCDIPFINRELIQFLMNHIFNVEDCIAPIHFGSSEPLCAIYHKNCAMELKQLIESNKLSVRTALAYLNTQFIDVTEQSFYSEKLFLNINSKEELTNITEELYDSNKIYL